MKFYVSSAFLDTREIVEVAKVADDLGYDGMAIPDHIVNLETLSTPYPYTKDGSRRWQPFTEWPDPWVLVGSLAQVTSRLRFVTTVYIPAMRNPYSAAKAIGTAAYLADGRVELGLAREHWRSGAAYAVGAVASVVAVIAVGALLPLTRPMFMNHHYATISGALMASMIIIPLQTVIPEELAFRGVLHGALNRAWGFRGVGLAGSLLFGLWHSATSLGLTSSNVGFTRVFGGGVIGMLAGVVLAVIATAAAGFVFSWLRRRSGSLLAPIALHWSLNGLGALAAALVWQLSA